MRGLIRAEIRIKPTIYVNSDELSYGSNFHLWIHKALRRKYFPGLILPNIEVEEVTSTVTKETSEKKVVAMLVIPQEDLGNHDLESKNGRLLLDLL